MNDAVKPAVSDEMVELFGINFWPINAASKIDAQREHIRNALSAALAVQGQEPVGVPEGWLLVPEKPTIEMVKKAHKDHEGEPWLPYSLWESMISAAPQPPAEDGWRDIASADKDAATLMLGIVRNGVLEEIHIGGFRYAYNEDEVSCWWSDQCDDEIVPTHWMPLPPAPANGGDHG